MMTPTQAFNSEKATFSQLLDSLNETYKFGQLTNSQAQAINLKLRIFLLKRFKEHAISLNRFCIHNVPPNHQLPERVIADACLQALLEHKTLTPNAKQFLARHLDYTFYTSFHLHAACLYNQLLYLTSHAPTPRYFVNSNPEREAIYQRRYLGFTWKQFLRRWRVLWCIRTTDPWIVWLTLAPGYLMLDALALAAHLPLNLMDALFLRGKDQKNRKTFHKTLPAIMGILLAPGLALTQAMGWLRGLLRLPGFYAQATPAEQALARYRYAIAPVLFSWTLLACVAIPTLSWKFITAGVALVALGLGYLIKMMLIYEFNITTDPTSTPQVGLGYFALAWLVAATNIAIAWPIPWMQALGYPLLTTPLNLGLIVVFGSALFFLVHTFSHAFKSLRHNHPLQALTAKQLQALAPQSILPLNQGNAYKAVTAATPTIPEKLA